MARDYYFDVLDPGNPLGPKIQARLSGELYLHHYKCNYVKYLNLIAARHVLSNTLAIFEGVRDFQEGGWCYLGRPTSYYLRENVEAPLEHSRVFAVYINPAMGVYEWRLEVADANGSSLPEKHENRFKRLVWKATF